MFGLGQNSRDEGLPGSGIVLIQRPVSTSHSLIVSSSEAKQGMNSQTLLVSISNMKSYCNYLMISFINSNTNSPEANHCPSVSTLILFTIPL